jgi:hypothetical protein
MNVKGNVEAQVNVVPLFGNFAQEFLSDPLSELIEESEMGMTAEELPPLRKERRKTVREDQFPEQGLFILDQQLQTLKESVARIKFYLSDMDDLLPK